MVNVLAASQADARSWREYVLAHPLGTVFHLPAWSHAVRRAYGHRPVHLIASEAQRVVGLLPLFLVKSIFVGRVLVSVPYATYGGILADSHEVALLLLERARQLCRRHRVEYLELRHREPRDLELPTFGRYDTFRRELPAKGEDVLGWLPRKTRAAARKGCELLEVEIAPDRKLLDTVYDLYAVALRRLGSPNYRRSFFRALAENYGERCVSLVVRDGRRPVAGVVSFVFRDEIAPYFSGSGQAGMAKNANNVMYVRLMEYAVARGLRIFDFNRTRRDNPGPYSFKRHHGFEPQPLHYQILLNKASRPPDLSPSNRKFALAGRAWRRLPLSLTRMAGAIVSKWIP